MTAANIQDRSGGFPLLEQTYNRFPRIRHVWADAGYTGQLVRWARETLGWTMDIVKGVVGQRGFVVQPRRWVVERSLAWLTRSRRLSRDYEILPQTTEAWFYLANIRLMLRRLERSV
ncbi:transposase [Deinococcus piscis]|uniref:transposase n=1 Tax=Deinococcus piscis TaxID=394230 RepID=UPI00227D7394|nr:transposase [Deinococcus piscis]